ncbi:MAG: hypothetical protein ACRDMV_23035 [Streptosporangiales bacterium]
MRPSPTPPGPRNARPAPPYVPLSAGLPTANKVVVIVLSSICVVVVLPIGGLLTATFLGFGGALRVLGVLLLVLMLGVLFVIVWAFFRVVRCGARLRGTEVTVRGGFRTHRVDLATAQMLRVATANNGWSVTPQIPTLEAHGDAQGRSATVVFRTARSGYLPLPEVEALVWAIRAGRRPPLPAQQAEQAVRELYLRTYSPYPQQPRWPDR